MEASIFLHLGGFAKLSSQSASLWNTQPLKAFVLSVSDCQHRDFMTFADVALPVLSIRETAASGPAALWLQPHFEIAVAFALCDTQL